MKIVDVGHGEYEFRGRVMTRLGKFYVYCITPIDLWHPLLPLEIHLAEMYRNGNLNGALGLEAFVEQAKEAIVASDQGWEGDVREGPYIVFLPFDVQTGPGAVCLKQNSNGTTFVASLIPMPQLDEIDMDREEWPEGRGNLLAVLKRHG